MREVTEFILLFTVFLLVLYDIVAVLDSGMEATISRVILDYSYKYPIIPFAAGVLCGHLFFPQRY